MIYLLGFITFTILLILSLVGYQFYKTSLFFKKPKFKIGEIVEIHRSDGSIVAKVVNIRVSEFFKYLVYDVEHLSSTSSIWTVSMIPDGRYTEPELHKPNQVNKHIIFIEFYRKY